jgi:hypothetical protein
VLGINGCTTREKCELSIQKFDYRKPYEETLDFGFCNLNPVYFHLKVSGTLEGDILIQEFYKLSGTGKIDTLIVSDYYADKFQFFYRPLGDIKADLEFKVSLR